MSVSRRSLEPLPQGNHGKYSRNISSEQKICMVCERTLPIRMFAATGNYSKTLGRKFGDHTCRSCRESQRRAAGVPERHQRYDAHGRVWCNRCRRYLPPTEFRRHPQRPHTYWSYCKPCTREIDRIRHFRKHEDPVNRIADNERHNELRRKRRDEEFRQRREELVSCINRLLRKGLTRQEICRLAGISAGNLISYLEKATRRPDPNTVERVAALDRLTLGWPKGEQCFRRRTPHPRLPELEAAMDQVRDAYPRRDIWRNRTR